MPLPLSPARSNRAMVAGAINGAAPSTSTQMPGAVTAARNATNSSPGAAGSAMSGIAVPRTPSSGRSNDVAARCSTRTTHGAGRAPSSA